jgi:hypothetical protein
MRTRHHSNRSPWEEWPQLCPVFMTTTTISRIFWCSILGLLYYMWNLGSYINVIYKITILSNSRYLIWGCIARERWWFLKVPIIDEQVFLDYETPMRKSARHRWKRIIRSECKLSTRPELNQLQLIYCFLLIYDLSSLHHSNFVRFPKQMSASHCHMCLFCIVFGLWLYIVQCPILVHISTRRIRKCCT